jgi:2-oxoglutarate dehydrogenase E2 component (dihydrolipoamide succinyltransferase)
MAIEVKVPMLPESVADATVAVWHKKVGDKVNRDENIVDLETDKVVLEVPAPQAGVIAKILQAEGARVNANQILAVIEAATADTKEVTSTAKPAAATAPTPAAAQKQNSTDLSPSVRRLVAEKEVDVSGVKGTGKGGRVTKDDVSQVLTQNTRPAAAASSYPAMTLSGDRPEKRVPMTRLRARIAERLLSAQHNAALLTTFNEINMKAVMDLRNQYKDSFEKTHGVRLGFMSFFCKAAIEALKRFPAVNASIDGDDIVYHGYFDIGMAVSTERGLVVPVLRNADSLSMAEIESNINEYASRARDGKLSIEEMTGGTFTITNGGVFGSLLATPIINPPQSGILGLHKIEDRPIAENGQVVIRPMMYVALTYDHRMIDGKESVQFLRTIKEMIEDPARLLLEV